MLSDASPVTIEDDGCNVNAVRDRLARSVVYENRCESVSTQDWVDILGDMIVYSVRHIGAAQITFGFHTSRGEICAIDTATDAVAILSGFCAKDRQH